MTARNKHVFRLVIQFAKLQLAGGIIFVGTYLGYFVSDYVFNRPSLYTLAMSSLIAHGVFFLVTRGWVFDKKTGKKRSRQQIIRFALFMGSNFVLNLIIIEVLRRYLGLSPYVGQLISAPLLGIWSYFGLKLWVFQEKFSKSLPRKASAR